MGYETRIKALERALVDQREKAEVDLAIEKKRLEDIIKQLESENHEMNDKIEEAEKYRREKQKFLDQIDQLKHDVEQEKKNRLQEVTEVQREKLQATEKLRREMLKQIKMTKASLLALSDDQLQTTTRLTILQNTQLTIELEYQSK